MPGFDAAEWRPVRAWFARRLFALGRWLMPPQATGRHRMIRPGALTDSLVVYESDGPEGQRVMIGLRKGYSPPARAVLPFAPTKPAFGSLKLPAEIDPEDDAREPALRP